MTQTTQTTRKPKTITFTQIVFDDGNYGFAYGFLVTGEGRHRYYDDLGTPIAKPEKFARVARVGRYRDDEGYDAAKAFEWYVAKNLVMRDTERLPFAVEREIAEWHGF